MKLKAITALSVFICLFGSLHAEEEAPFFELNEDELNHEKKELNLLDLTVQTNLAFRYFPRKIPYYIKQFEIQNFTETPEYKYFVALNYYNRNLKSESLLNAMKSIALNPEYPPSLNLIGVLYTEAGRIADATDYFRRSVAVSPWDPTFNYNYANNLYKLNRPGEAVSFANSAIELKSNVRDAAYLKGLILMELKNPSEASQAFALARSNGLDTEEFYKKYMKVVLETQDELKSLELLPFIEKYNDTESRRMAASVRFKMGEYLMVIRLLSAFIYTDEAVLKDKEYYLISSFKLKGKFDEIEKLAVDDSEKIYLTRILENLTAAPGSVGPEIRDPILNPIN